MGTVNINQFNHSLFLTNTSTSYPFVKEYEWIPFSSLVLLWMEELCRPGGHQVPAVRDRNTSHPIRL
jgi:hypothetical protein